MGVRADRMPALRKRIREEGDQDGARDDVTFCFCSRNVETREWPKHRLAPNFGESAFA
jgi:hypothetical protein